MVLLYTAYLTRIYRLCYSGSRGGTSTVYAMVCVLHYVCP